MIVTQEIRNQWTLLKDWGDMKAMADDPNCPCHIESLKRYMKRNCHNIPEESFVFINNFYQARKNRINESVNINPGKTGLLQKNEAG